MITKRQLLRVFKTQTAVAQILGCTVANVSYWKMDAPIPVHWELQLHMKFPERFARPQDKDLLPRLLAAYGVGPQKNPPRGYSGRLKVKLPTVP